MAVRQFSVYGTNQTVQATTSTALVWVNPTRVAPNFNIEFLRWWCSQAANATSAQQFIQVTQIPTGYPQGTAATPAKFQSADPNASTITGAANGAPGTSGITSTSWTGALATLISDAFNVLNGWLHVPTPAEPIIAATGFTSATALLFTTAPGTLTSWSFGTIFREC